MKKALFVYIALILISIYAKIWWLLILLIIIGCGGVLLLILFVGIAVEGGFRNQFPYDFVMKIGWVVDFLKTKGFTLSGYNNEGTDYPEAVLTRNSTEKVVVRLNAPLLSFKPYTISVKISSEQEKEWTFNVDAEKGPILKELDSFVNRQ